MIQNKDYKQLIIARKDLNMSPGKLAAQVSHASMAFLTNQIKEQAYREVEPNSYIITLSCKEFINGEPRVQLYKHPNLMYFSQKNFNEGKDVFYLKRNGLHWEECSEDEIEINYKAELTFDKDLYENWINGSFTKVVCEAKNKNKLMKTVEIAAGLGLKENEDYFIIRDNCLTELEPEEVDENGVGRTITCIGFVPLPAVTANLISKKFQLYTYDNVEPIQMTIKALEQEPKTGHWVKIKPYPLQMHDYECSECGHETDDNTENYCSYCGAKMLEPYESEVKTRG